MRLLAISGTIIGSKTFSVVKKVVELVKEADQFVEIELLDLRSYNLQFCDGRNIEDYNEDTRKAIQMLSNADFYIIGVPIFHGSFPGVFKNLLDLVPQQVFHNKVMAFIATGGNDQHYLVVENQLKPIAGYFKAHIVPDFAYVQNKHFNAQNEIIASEVLETLSQLVDKTCTLQNRLNL